MGSGRAGWYSWDVIDNGGTRSSTSIEPGLQDIGRGDVMPAVPGATDAFVVAAVDPPRGLVLTVPDGLGGIAVAWEHLLEPLGRGRTRLIVRGRASSQWVDRARTKPPADRRPIFIERLCGAGGASASRAHRIRNGADHELRRSRIIGSVRRDCRRRVLRSRAPGRAHTFMI
jgi:hypothetical protein